MSRNMPLNAVANELARERTALNARAAAGIVASFEPPASEWLFQVAIDTNNWAYNRTLILLLRDMLEEGRCRILFSCWEFLRAISPHIETDSVAENSLKLCGVPAHYAGVGGLLQSWNGTYSLRPLLNHFKPATKLLALAMSYALRSLGSQALQGLVDLSRELDMKISLADVGDFTALNLAFSSRDNSKLIDEFVQRFDSQNTKALRMLVCLWAATHDDQATLRAFLTNETSRLLWYASVEKGMALVSYLVIQNLAELVCKVYATSKEFKWCQLYTIIRRTGFHDHSVCMEKKPLVDDQRAKIVRVVSMLPIVTDFVDACVRMYPIRGMLASDSFLNICMHTVCGACEKCQPKDGLCAPRKVQGAVFLTAFQLTMDEMKRTDGSLLCDCFSDEPLSREHILRIAASAVLEPRQFLGSLDFYNQYKDALE